MITDERTSRILAQAKQRRADLVGDYLGKPPVVVVLVLAVAGLATTVNWNISPDVTTASHQAEQVTENGKR